MRAPTRLAALLALVALAAPPTAAHQPVAAIEGRMLALPDTAVSWSIDGRIEEAADVDWIRLPAPPEGRLLVDVLLPADPAAEDAPLAAALVGRALGGAKEAPPGIVAAEGEGVRLASAAAGERFCHVGFCWYERVRFVVPSPSGTYHLAVWSSTAPLAYTVAVGMAETPPPEAPRLLPDPAPGEPASGVRDDADAEAAPMPGVVEFFYGNAFAPNAEPALALALFGVPALALALVALALVALGRRRRAARMG